MKVNCNDIKVGKRVRKDLGSLDSLMNSIKELGLLQPIGITENNELIFGQRRLLACQSLGWSEVEVNIININDIIRGEYDENCIRKDFTMSERHAIKEMVEPKIEADAKERQLRKPICCAESAQQNNIGDGGRGAELAHLIGKTRDKTAALLGVGRSKMKQEEAIMSYGNKEIIEKVDSGELSTDAAFKEIKDVKKKEEKEERLVEEKDLAGVYDKTFDKTIEIIHNDFYDYCMNNIDSNSIDIIITDPPYPKDYLYLWKQLSEVANKVLKPGGFLISYSGQYHLPIVMNSLAEYLEYYWTFCLYHVGPSQIVNAKNVMCKWKPILIYQKQPVKKLDRTIPDYIVSEIRDKDKHEWGQSESGVGCLIEAFTKPNDLILDPCCGGGTTLCCAKKLKRRAIGIDIDEVCINTTKARLV